MVSDVEDRQIVQEDELAVANSTANVEFPAEVPAEIPAKVPANVSANLSAKKPAHTNAKTAKQTGTEAGTAAGFHSAARTQKRSGAATGLIAADGGAPRPDALLGAGHDRISFDEYVDALEIERNAGSEGLSLYVHLPFCPSRCLTCDHQTSVSHDSRQIDRYLDAMEREVELITEHLGRGRLLQQLHLGGGTPNYLSELQLVRLLDIIDRHFSFDERTETSLEANAHRASQAQLTLLHGLGFRAINLELRDLDPTVQQALGRRQSLPVVRDVIESARQVGFDRVSADLVYGLPRQSTDTIRTTIEKLIGLDPDRISCYTFSRRPEFFQHQCAVEQNQMPSLGDKVAIFSRIVDGLQDAGYDWIGLDCFARPEDPITQAHKAGVLHRNWIGYTDKPGRSLVGLGSSATTDLSTICARNHMSIDEWRKSLEQGVLPVESGTRLTPAGRERRHALSDLMCNLQHGSPATFEPSDGEESATVLGNLAKDGYVEVSSNGIAITETGRYALHQLWGDASPSYRWGSLL
ncbi:MAG: radical SAM protein [Halieaceae bacterium]|jgi:oxygen-independent coproporphyrinogen-3 oxidase|nr:radical SAM protein [Halieaceae bacterium]